MGIATSIPLEKMIRKVNLIPHLASPNKIVNNIVLDDVESMYKMYTSKDQFPHTSKPATSNGYSNRAQRRKKLQGNLVFDYFRTKRYKHDHKGEE